MNLPLNGLRINPTRARHNARLAAAGCGALGVPAQRLRGVRGVAPSGYVRTKFEEPRVRRTERSLEDRGWAGPGTRSIQPRVGEAAASRSREARRRCRALRISALWPSPHGRWRDQHSRGTRRRRPMRRMRAGSMHRDGSGCEMSETHERRNRRRRTPHTRWRRSVRPRAGS